MRTALKLSSGGMYSGSVHARGPVNPWLARGVAGAGGQARGCRWCLTLSPRKAKRRRVSGRTGFSEVQVRGPEAPRDHPSATLGVPHPLAQRIAVLFQVNRLERGSRRGLRALTPFHHTDLVLQ